MKKALAIMVFVLVSVVVQTCRPEPPKPAFPTLEPSTWATMEAHEREWSK